MFQYDSYGAVLLICFVISVISGILLLKIKFIPDYKIGSLMLFSYSIWVISYLLKITAAELSLKILFNKLEFLGIIPLPVIFFFLVLKYSGHEAWITKSRIFYVSLIPFIALVLIATNEFHKLVWPTYKLIFTGSQSFVVNTYGIGYWICISYIYLLALIGFVILIHQSTSKFKIFKLQSLIMFVVVLLPVLASILFITKALYIRNYDFTPIAFLISSAIFIYGVRKRKIGDVTPIYYESIVNSMVDNIIVINKLGRIIFVNKQTEKFLGKEEYNLIGNNLFFVFPELKEHLEPETYLKEDDFAHFRRGRDAEGMHIFIKDGKLADFDIIVNNYLDKSGRIIGHIIVLRDISEKIAAEENINYLNFHDQLTCLYNRAYFEKELSRFDCKKWLPLSFIICDINGLRIVNESFGHTEGDRLLVDVGNLLKESCRKEDIIARWGGDEFAILLSKTTEEVALTVTNRILERCSRYNSSRIPLSLSIGSSTKNNKNEEMQKTIIEAENRMNKRKMLESQSTSSSILASLKSVLWEKSHETEEHGLRMHDMALELGGALRLPANQLDDLALLANIHDIGKIGISDKILKKIGQLNEAEWTLMKEHPAIGYRISCSIPQLASIADYILAHHEAWDGSGYPGGIKGSDIPLLSRIITLVDAYDVMMHDRPYKKAVTKDEAIKEIKRCSGSQFDPELVEVFLKIISKKRSSKS